MKANLRISARSASLAKALLRLSAGNPVGDVFVWALSRDTAFVPEQDYRCDMT